LTTLLSREIVEYRRLLVHDDSAESGMWQWHAREELGHCDVAMDVAAHLGLGRTRRVFALVLATGYLGYDVLCGTFALCRCDVANGARRGALFIDACRFAAASLPALARMTVGWWRYVITPARASH
jgi:predicted metal-dependent hydrolase